MSTAVNNKHFSKHNTADSAREHAMNLSADHPSEEIIVVKSSESGTTRFYVEIDYGSMIRSWESIDSRWAKGKRLKY